MFSILFLKAISVLPLSVMAFFEDIKNNKNGIVRIEDRYGLEAFVGLAGEGKTMSMVEKARHYRKKYGNSIYIFANFNCKFADATFKDYKQLLHNFRKSVLVLYDEMPNEFNKNNHKEFPTDLFQKLTQLRKNNGVKILYTTQDIMLIDPDIRRLTRTVNECRTFKRRLTYYCTYDMNYYKQMQNSVSVDSKDRVIKDSFHWFVQTKELRDSYDSFIFLDSAKK